MKNNIVPIDAYQPQQTDRFFFDTNIWMLLYCPIGSYKKELVGKYDGFLKKVLSAGATVCISSLVLSEFCNAYLRLEFNRLKIQEPDKYKDFKRDFRSTDGYRDLMREVVITVKGQILKLARRIDDRFSHIAIEDIFDNMEQHDFNDKYYLALAESESLKLVTNDADFSTSTGGILILTANNRLLGG